MIKNTITLKYNFEVHKLKQENRKNFLPLLQSRKRIILQQKSIDDEKKQKNEKIIKVAKYLWFYFLNWISIN